MLRTVLLAKSVHYIHPYHKKWLECFLPSDLCVLSASFIFNLHLFLEVHWGLLHLSIWFLSLSSYCNLLPLVIQHYPVLDSFMRSCTVAAATRNRLPASEGIYIFFNTFSFENTCFSCIYDAKLFCPSLLLAMKNACFNLPYMLCHCILLVCNLCHILCTPLYYTT